MIFTIIYASKKGDKGDRGVKGDKGDKGDNNPIYTELGYMDYQTKRPATSKTHSKFYDNLYNFIED